MSAIEWLSFISPFIWILVVLNGLALLPLQLKTRLPMRVKFTLALCAIALAGWLMAFMAIHITTPTIRINVLQASQVLLIPTVIALVVTLMLSLIQGKNILVTLLKKLVQVFKLAIRFLAFTASVSLYLFARAYSKYANEKYEDDQQEEERQKRDGPHINYRGEYSGQDNRHKY